MNAENHSGKQSRRTFLLGGVGGAGLLGVAALGVWAHRSGSKTQENPYAYDLSRFQRTDPDLIQYEESGRIERLRQDPRRIAFGPNDQLYLAAGNYVCALDLEGKCRTEIALDTAPRSLAVGSDGLLYIGLRDHIEVYDAKGKRRAVWDAASQRTWITGIAVSSDVLYAADAGHRVVLQYDLEGKVMGRIGEKDPDRNIPGFVVPSPYFEVEMHPDGLLRVTNPGRHQIEAYTREGDLELSWGRASAALDGFCGCCNPVNMAILADGRFVTCEKGLPRVKVYEVDGTLESVVAGPESFLEKASFKDGPLLDYAEGILDVAVDSAGRIFILDTVADSIRVMTRKPALQTAGLEASV